MLVMPGLGLQIEPIRGSEPSARFIAAEEIADVCILEHVSGLRVTNCLVCLLNNGQTVRLVEDASLGQLVGARADVRNALGLESKKKE